VLHDLKSHRPSLALDLVEEFRPLIVDSVVLSLFRRGQLE
jgi:CRISP-associated protein Cas1